MSALLEDDWYREACELKEHPELLRSILSGVNIFLFLDSDKVWKTITQKNIRKKIYRPCDYFKDNIWIVISDRKKVITTPDNILYTTLVDLETYLSSGILIRKNKLSELPNIWKE